MWTSTLPARLKPLAALTACTVLDTPKGDTPPLTLFASVGWLAHHLGIDATNVRRRLRELERLGVLVKLTPGGCRSNLHRPPSVRA
jgi:hypothetical protein